MGGVKCLGDQIAERATVAEMEGGREEEDRRKLLADEVGWGDERKEGRKKGSGGLQCSSDASASCSHASSHGHSCIDTLDLDRCKY